MFLALVVFITLSTLAKSQALQQYPNSSTAPFANFEMFFEQLFASFRNFGLYNKISDLLRTRASQLLPCTKYKTLNI